MGNIMAETEGLDRARYHLEGWAFWRKVARGTVTRGYPNHSAGLATGGASSEFDEMVNEADFTAAKTCDSVIGELPDLYRFAIESEYLLQGVIKYNRRSTADLLHDSIVAFWDRSKKWLV